MDNELFEIAQQLGRLLKSKEKKIATASLVRVDGLLKSLPRFREVQPGLIGVCNLQ